MKTIEINQIEYQFCDHINDDPALLAGFNALATESFGISFASVGGDYEPHVLICDGRVVANVSVNQIPFIRDGQRILLIQLGTVMTHPDYRGRGLSRWLMEQILDRWQGNCDGIYLFANDGVLDFYPKFGFRSASEWECRVRVPRRSGTLRQLNMDDHADWALLWEKFARGNPYSALYMTDNHALLNFYAGGFRRDCFYYAAEYDLVLALEEDEGLWCLDIFGRSDVPLADALALLPPSENGEIRLGFSPREAVGTLLPHREEDTTLFVLGDDPFAGAQRMFPLLSHA